MSTELNKFVNACIKKGKYEEMGDSKEGNKQYKIIRSVYIELKTKNRLYEFLGLLAHENPYVKLWAALYTLQIAPEQAENTLESMIDIKGSLVGFSAQMTLQEWKKGNLKF